MTAAVPTPIKLADDECHVLFTTTHKMQASASKACLNRFFGFSAIYNPKPFKMKRINLFYSGEFLSYLFGEVLNSDNVRDYICGVMENNCEETFKLNNLTQASCQATYDSLPSTNTEGMLDKHTFACV